MRKFITTSKTQTQKLGENLARELKGACPPKRRREIICLSGDLGAGKTTFTQGLLKGLKIKGPHTSPTFVIMKKYNDIYHFDAYRINEKDILGLGWKEIIADKNNIIIIEWAERVKNIIPKNALWIKFKWVGENSRELKFS
ncbi:MAG: tRNA (adenosine(37)-N6)-threonylcarbamoyltransferase complex ATPase subunit type 1 TsaE [Patescibacteria group bacterium]